METSGKYGEPWSAGALETGPGIRTKDHMIEFHGPKEFAQRAARCVTALNSCPNPEAFITAVERARIKYLEDRPEGLGPIIAELATDPALDWLSKGNTVRHAPSEKQQTETSQQFDEPWKVFRNIASGKHGIQTKRGKIIAEFKIVMGLHNFHHALRAALCVNEFDGCKDPKGFMSAVRYVAAGHRAMRQALKAFADTGGEADPFRTLQRIKQILDTHEVDPRLTWLPWREPKKKKEEEK